MNPSTVPVDVQSLSKSFSGKPVLEKVSAQVQQGDVIGLLGLNGAGKTTLLESMLGFCVPDTGSITLFGHNALQLDAATKARIGFVPQRDELIEHMKGKQYLDTIAQFYPGWNKALVERLVGEWAIPLDSRINSLSVGQRQKLSIVAALGHEPELLVLDEPVASLDPLARRLFLRELINIGSSSLRSILFSTHIVSDLERIASRVWLVKDGRIAIDASLDEIKEHYARVHLTGSMQVLPELPGLLHQRRELQANVLVFRDWNTEARSLLETACPGQYSVEPLSLEEIFLELHS